MVANMWNTGIIVLVGIWMVLAPFLIAGIDGQAWNSRIAAALVVFLVVAVPGTRRWEALAAAAVAVWLMASSLVPALLVDGGRLWNDIGVGILFIITGARATAKTSARTNPALKA
jgi:hypothetical protein